nr:MAG: hypothetical protein [Bacteriophage sp.]
MAKFIGVKMIEAVPMRASMALSAGYKLVMLIQMIWVMK